MCELINGDGTFNVHGVENFVEEVKLSTCGLSYVVVSIIGPQSSGKSTLINHLFGTNFKEMDARKGRKQTTKGIMIARSSSVNEPTTLVLDIEGTDSHERGEDDTAFEKQSAVFALAVSDVVLINMWYHDIGREHAANKPLLRTVFQARMRLSRTRKTTLIFVIRDMSNRTPFDIVEQQLKDDIQKIWEKVPKTKSQNDIPTCLSEFYNVEVVALSSYEDKFNEFHDQVMGLKQRFFNSLAPGGLAEDRQEVVPALVFCSSVKEIWKSIQENKDLDLPNHRVIVAMVRCQQIADEKYKEFIENQDWLELKEASQSGLVSGLGEKLFLAIGGYLSKYASDAKYFDAEVRQKMRNSLKDKLLQLVDPVLQSNLGYLLSKTIQDFKEAFGSDASGKNKYSLLEHFDKECQGVRLLFTRHEDEDATFQERQKGIWDSIISRRRSELLCVIEKHVSSFYEPQLDTAVVKRVEIMLDEASNKTWPSIKTLVRNEMQSVSANLATALVQFDLDEKSRENILNGLEVYARGLVEAIAKENARDISTLMRNRFIQLFNYSHAGGLLPRKWKNKKEIESTASSARDACLTLLSVLAAIQLDGKFVNIEQILHDAFVGDEDGEFDTLPSSRWGEISLLNTLISPKQCKLEWEKLREVIEDNTTNAVRIMKEQREEKVKIGLAAAQILARIIMMFFGIHHHS